MKFLTLFPSRPRKALLTELGRMSNGVNVLSVSVIHALQITVNLLISNNHKYSKTEFKVQ
ncbi:hypothetical protein [Flammeovirga sp. SJP92]|uniref:hypothetical protein n=1 Tax=Flammeovirga sp. SJP92 TaxID=1775430 RepID=UPI0012F9538B|nr:hypothetical protein [Flammeovirga sp. SJP92]